MNIKTVKTWAVLDNDGIIANTVAWDGETDWFNNQQLIDLADWPGVGIGWKWTGSSFIDVRPPIDYDI